jgi:long-chain acyl-CoA synthetase
VESAFLERMRLAICRLESSQSIEHLVPYNVALIVLDPDASAAFANRHELADPAPEAMAREPLVREQVSAGVERANAKLSRVEQIKRFAILPCDWAPAGDELTPTMKLRRRPIAAKYAAEIDALYSDPG